MLLKNLRCMVLNCDCPHCRNPGETKSIVCVYGSEGEPAAKQAARNAGWEITEDDRCIAPGHKRYLRLEYENDKSRDNEIEID